MPGEAPPLVDGDALAAYLDRCLPEGLLGTVVIERHLAGHSNETFFVTAGDREWVLRRPPRGAFLPTAHDVRREYRVLTALADTAVRSPRPVLVCDDHGVIGAPFYLMQRVHGVVIRDSLPASMAGDDEVPGTIGTELVDALAELHAVDWRAVGLEGFGRPEGYLQRQLRRWSGQLALTEPLTRTVPDLHRVTGWLETNLPPARSTQATIVHGDYKLDNVVFTDPGATLAAILDWEMSTVGDPLADVGWMLSFWREPGDPVELVMDEQSVTRAPGFPTREELVARYSERSGRDASMDDLLFYLVLAVWKLAVLLEGSYARHLAGATDDPFFEQLAEGVPALAARALALTAG
jgi:aminoglycoside phosphotransferase (APT) family kinase protein